MTEAEAEEETEAAVADLLPTPSADDALERQLTRDEEMERQHHEHHEAPALPQGVRLTC